LALFKFFNGDEKKKKKEREFKTGSLSNIVVNFEHLFLIFFIGCWRVLAILKYQKNT